MTGTITLTAVAISFLGYIFVGLKTAKRIRGLGDLLPIGVEKEARVDNAVEFSTSTVATTISLATVVLAFFELASYFGLWLLWTVLTTALGLFAVHYFSRIIWGKMSAYGKHRPTLHEFIGTEFNSPTVAFVAALCTTIGFLGAFAVELTVGSKFLAALIPELPSLFTTIGLATLALFYTSIGGFRAVIITNRYQMRTIWLMLGTLLFFFVWHLSINEMSAPIDKLIPPMMYNFAWRDGLFSFLIGVFLINVPTFLSDMSVWQRIAGSHKPETVTDGLVRSIVSATTTWTALILFACLVPLVTTAKEGQNPLVALLYAISSSGQVGSILFFLIVIGLYAAMLSTASTQLIATTHAFYEDVLLKKKSVAERMNLSSELRNSRITLLIIAVIAVGIVEILSAVGFTIADLVFAIYGSQLSLFPTVALALFGKREYLAYLSKWTVISVGLGFVAGWSVAGFGKYIGNSDMVFLAPAFSLFTATIILGLGVITTRHKNNPYHVYPN